MGKMIVVVLATLMVIGLCMKYIGANHMGQVLYVVPQVGFAITWSVIAGLISGIVMWRVIHVK